MKKRTDLDREYSPDHTDQLVKDLVAARGTPLNRIEKASLARWKKLGISARIRRLPDRSLTCWPVGLSTQTGRSHVGGKPASPAEAMAYLRGETDYKVSVGVRFDKSDLDLLRAAALTEKDEDDKFNQAVSAIERDSFLVVRVMNAEELREIILRFHDVGVVHVTLDTLRIGETQPVRM